MENIKLKFIPPPSKMTESVLKEMKADSKKPIMGSIMLYHNGGEARNISFTNIESMTDIFNKWKKDSMPLIRRGDKIKLVVEFASSKFDK